MALILSGDTGPGFVQSAAQPTGSVLQVVFGSTSNSYSTTSATFGASNLTASITPKFATSKIYIQCALPIIWSGGGIGIALYKNGSVLFNPSAQDGGGKYYLGYGAAGTYVSVPLHYLDSPSTTSATTYTIYTASYNGTNSVSMPFAGSANNATATITLMEVAG